MKQAIDRAARFFWSVSYGQLYPELRRLRDAGLLTSREEMTGGRRRTVYELTAAGEEELARWLDDSDELLFELRAEGLLKLFVAADLGRERNLALVRAFRARVQEQQGLIRATEPAREIGRRIRDFGVEMYGVTAEWCDALEQAILAGELDDRR
jgi:PadR family transcriptional regulator AphA